MTAPNETENPTGETSDEEVVETGEELTDEQRAEAEAAETRQQEMDALPDWAREAITKANGEAANYRVRLREAEQRLQEAKTPEEFAAATAELVEKNKELERSLLTTKVQSKYKLPKALADLLKGDDEAALEAHAKELAALIKVEPDTLSGGLTPGSGSAEETDPRALRKKGRRR